MIGFIIGTMIGVGLCISIEIMITKKYNSILTYI